MNLFIKSAMTAMHMHNKITLINQDVYHLRIRPFSRGTTQAYNGQLDPTERYECFESVHGIVVPYLTHVLCRNVYIFPLDLVIY